MANDVTGKINNASYGVMCTMLSLFEKNLTMPELIASISKLYPGVEFNNFVASKYVNTCKSCGFDIQKINGKYSFVNFPVGKKFTDNEALLAYQLEEFSEDLKPSQINKDVNSFFEKLHFIIGYKASNGLKSIFIPAKVTSTSNIISGCGSLISISVSPQNTVWDSRNGCNALIRTSDNTLVQGSVNTIIPDGVVTIGTDAFSTASDGIAIESVKMPNSVKKIGIRAFIRCKKLKSVELSSSVETIEMNAFQNCTALTSVVSKIETPFKFGTNAFYNINPACVLTVPKGKRQAYIDAGWTEDIFKGGIVEVEDEIPGDMNGDGSVTIADVTKLVNKVLGKDEPSSNP